MFGDSQLSPHAGINLQSEDGISVKRDIEGQATKAWGVSDRSAVAAVDFMTVYIGTSNEEATSP